MTVCRDAKFCVSIITYCLMPYAYLPFFPVNNP